LIKSNNDYKAKTHEDTCFLTVRAEGQEKMFCTRLQGKMEAQNGKNSKNIRFLRSKAYVLPFKIKLNDFIAEKYPGTEKVTLRLKVK
jgi:hypothetical protein